MRALALVVVVAACGGSQKPQAAPPLAQTKSADPGPAEPPPPPAPELPPAAKSPAPEPQVARGGDPCEGGEVQGGLAGTGAGGQGDGLGLGSIGTIGHGSGTGSSGGGGMSGRKTTLPAAKLGEGTVKGGLDKAIVRRYLKRNIQKFLYCYEKQLINKPKLAGTLFMTFTVDDQGRVTKAATSTGLDTDVESCVTNVLQTIQYPKPADGGTAEAKFPITYTNP